MKSIIILTLLLSFGATLLAISPQGICSCEQLIYSDDCNNMPGCLWSNNSCSQISCNTYQQQNQCLQASKYCQWNVGPQNCSTFQGCSNIIIASQMNYKQCGQSNLQCLAYNGIICENILSTTFNLVCADFSDTCTENVGTDGVCIYNKQTSKCIPITSCSQATQQSQCSLLNQANGISCQYINNTCVQITGCNSFTQESTCKYYFPNFDSINMILCSWNNNQQQCIEAKNSLYLNNTNCLIQTGYNYRWLPTASNPINGICFTCKINQIPQIQIISRSQCQCSQFILQSDCNIEYCQWNTTTNLCSPIDCTQVTSQSICITLQGCYWNYQNVGGCVSFNQGQSCSSLPITINNAICAAQNVYCPGFSQGTCQNANTLNKCSTATTQTGCQNIIGSDGICRWINEICLPLQSCTQILDANYCGSWQNQCQWNAQLQLCQPITCSSYNKNQQKCMYVITGFQDSQYQLCRYNKTTSICENAYSSLGLTSENCVSNTASTYRWSNISSKIGMCISCSQKIINLQISATCQCSQYYLESDCNNTGYCQYTSEGCYQITCTNLVNQTICASTSNCYWNSQQGCLNFNGCTSLQSSSTLECLAQNINCKSYSNGSCSQQQYQFNCKYNIDDHDCITIIQTFRDERYTTQLCYQVEKSCYQITQCDQASQNSCTSKELQESCYWDSQNSICQQLTCSYFTDQNSCKYFIQKPLTLQLIVCQWNQRSKQCNNISNILTGLTSNTCQINTFNTFRWVPITDTNGLCVKCQNQQQIMETQIHNSCPCNYLLTQNDCLQSQQCYWNNNQCQNIVCSSILSQNLCISQESCIWSNNTCSNFNQNCTQLLGSSQLQCTSQQLTCIGTNGTNCTNILNNCESNLTINGCIEQIGSDGFCYWNQQQNICQSITQCQQLPQIICIQKSNACYYNQGSCQTITCQQLFQNTGKCNYIISLSQPNQLQSCILQNGSCQLATEISQLNEEQCYANVGGTTRWIPFYTQEIESIGTCQLCQRSLIPTNGIGKCSCYQLLTEQDCQFGSNACVWSTELKGCQPQTCTNITNQEVCSSTDGCAWSLNSQNVFSCSEFVSCNSVTGASLTLQNCLIYSIQCRGIQGNQCVQNPMTSCFNYPQSLCVDIIGTDGPCIYNNTYNVCEAITQCEQIKNNKICQFQNHLCTWINNKCQNITCNTITNENSCIYIITSFISGQLQLCQWNTQSNTCNNLISQQGLTSYNCAINTDFTYRWVPLNTSSQGICTKCVISQEYMAGECACSQIYTQMECQQNQTCQWNSNKCSKLPCISILSQYICSTNPNCLWSLQQDQCLQFTSCNNLQAINNLGCVIQSINCQAQSNITVASPCQTLNTSTCQQFTTQQNCQNNPSCQWMSSMNMCSTNFSCQGLDQQNCETSSIPGMMCLWNKSKKSCNALTECSQISSYSICMNLTRYCTWTQTASQTSPSCQPTACSYFTKQNCNYYFTKFELSTMSFCYWSNALNQCVVATQLETQYTYDNCYSNSMMSYRWTSTSKVGYCKSCMQMSMDVSNDNKISTNYICDCSYLNQSECIIAGPLCTYSNGKCIEQTNCTTILQNMLCTELKQCMWLNNTCVPFTNCAALNTATTPLECQLFSKQCPVYNSTNSTCTAALNCSTLQQTQCSDYNSQVETGFCVWNNNSCQSLSACTQITDISLCNVQKFRCQWNISTSSCGQFLCSSFKTFNACSFVYASFQSGEITLCQWNTTTSICQTVQKTQDVAITVGYNDIECYIKTGHTYYYNGDQCVQCVQQYQEIRNMMIVLLIMVWI